MESSENIRNPFDQIATRTPSFSSVFEPPQLSIPYSTQRYQQLTRTLEDIAYEVMHGNHEETMASGSSSENKQQGKDSEQGEAALFSFQQKFRQEL